MRLFSIALLFFVYTGLFSQSDLQRLQQADLKDSALSSKRKITYVFKGRNWFIKYNPVSLVFGGALYFYQGVISPQIMQGCAFDPSCSAFSKQCIREFGILKGVALSTDRLTRCTRLSAIDFHPVLIGKEGKVKDIPDYYRLKRNQ